jgi:peptidoglycan/LPS O-acetylase OafA/YrhL
VSSASTARDGLQSGARFSYLPALDGIRAIAIIAVLLYHGGIGWLSGGFLGVDVFFALSGYLITSLLIHQHVTGGRIGLRSFYNGRARRLLPALIVMLLVVATYSTLFMADSVASTWRDLPWVINGLSNWWFVLNQQSYFEAIGRPLLLQHTWSLAVEAQFYLIWPLVLLATLGSIGTRGVGRIALVCAAVSCAIMVWFGLHLDPAPSMAVSHLYFGTDTHSVGLFLGAALAAAWLPGVRRRKLTLLGRWTLELFSVAVLAGLALTFVKVNESTGEFYLIGFPAAGVLTVLLIVLATYPTLNVGRWLAWRPLRWIGERSYGMYLWHWPIFQATRPGVDVGLSALPDLVFRISLTALIAEASYRFVEMPVRRGALGRLWKRARAWSPAKFRWVSASAVATVLAIGCTEAVLANRAISAYAASLQPLMAPASENAPAPAVAKVGATGSSPHLAKHAGRHHAPVKARAVDAHPAARVPAMLVGDSVMLGVASWIKHSVNVVDVNAEVGRQAITTLDVVRGIVNRGQAKPTMIIDLGNNGTVEEPTLRAILSTLKGCKHVVVVNARVPRPWQDGNDALMRRVVPQYPNAALADWYNASAHHLDFFAGDGVHPTPSGAEVYTHAIVVALDVTERKLRVPPAPPKADCGMFGCSYQHAVRPKSAAWPDTILWPRVPEPARPKQVTGVLTSFPVFALER